MRSLEELVAPDSGLPTLNEWVRNAAQAQVIPPSDPPRADVLLALQVTTRSILGTLAWHTNGVLVDGGWLRHLGGAELPDWNALLGGVPLDPPLEGALVVALDAVGGVFAINSGGLPGDAGVMHYFAPDTQDWMSLEMGHSAFVEWSLSENLDQFYADLRWPGWQAEVVGMKADHAINFFPPLGFEKTPLVERSRRAVPRRQIWDFLNQIERQAAGLPDGTQVRFSVAWDKPEPT